MVSGKRRKRCEKCGHVSSVPAHQSKCRQAERNAFGLTGYICWGRLVKEAVIPANATRLKARPQEVAAEKAKVARRNANTYRERLAAQALLLSRLAKLITKWDRKADYYTRIVVMSDEQYAAFRARPPKKEKPIRAIKLEGLP